MAANLLIIWMSPLKIRFKAFKIHSFHVVVSRVGLASLVPKMAPNRTLFRYSIAVFIAVCLPIVATAFPTPAAGRRRAPASAEIRAIYLTGAMAGSLHGRLLAGKWRALGGNAVVFDIKDWDGDVSFNSPQPLAHPNPYTYIRNLAAWVGWLHAHGLYAIARIALFKDARLAQAHPELAVHTAQGGIWLDRGHSVWLDPSLPAVQNYDLGLAAEAARAGADEIQFDYVRFPVGGDQKTCRFRYQNLNPRLRRTGVISEFLHHARKTLHPYGVYISIDVFGITAWARPADVLATGQDITALAHQADIICPMIYPSHFFHHFDHLANPADEPGLLIHDALARFNQRVRNTPAVIRPWLQAFAWHTPIFSPGYIETQVATARSLHAKGFMLWNAENRYVPAERAMRAMAATPGKYFRGGFPYPLPRMTAENAPRRGADRME